LLSHYTDTSIVDSTIGAFTLLDPDLGNQLRIKSDRFILNIYFKTENSQLPTNYTLSGFQDNQFFAAAYRGKERVGAARAPVLDLIAAKQDDIGDFVKSITALKHYGEAADPAQTEIRHACTMFKRELNTFVTSRDSALLYWAFLQSYQGELSKYKDWHSCAGKDLNR